MHDLGLEDNPAGAAFGERLQMLDQRLRELSDLAGALVEKLRRGEADSTLADRFLAVWREAVRGEAVLELFREVERERQENQTLMDISMKLSSSSAIEEVLKTILDSLRQVVKFAAAGIFVYNREMQQIEIDMLIGYEGALREQIHKKFQEGVEARAGNYRHGDSDRPSNLRPRRAPGPALHHGGGNDAFGAGGADHSAGRGRRGA